MKPATIAWKTRRFEARTSRPRLGMEGYAHLSAILAEQPASVLAFVERSGLRKQSAYRYLMSMHTLGWAHISAWELKPRAKPIPVFAFGPGADAAVPLKTASGKDVQSERPLPEGQLCPSIIAFCQILRAMDEAPVSRVELIECTGLDKWAVCQAVETLIAAGMARISGWELRPQGGAPLPQYELGGGPQAKRPKPVRGAKQSTWKAKMKQVALLHAMAGAIPANEERRAA